MLLIQVSGGTVFGHFTHTQPHIHTHTHTHTHTYTHTLAHTHTPHTEGANAHGMYAHSNGVVIPHRNNYTI